MEYKKISPAGQISHTIESYVFLKTKDPVSFSDTFLPNGKPAIVFHFKSPFSFRNTDGDMEPLPKISFIGCQSVPVSLKNEGVIDSITVLLYPYSLYNLFRTKLEGLINFLDAAQYIPAVLVEKLALIEDIERRAELLDEFFSEKLNGYDPAGDNFKAICDYIVLNKGNIERKDLSGRFSLSESYIHKMFIKKMGISFKPYSRIVRVSNIIAEVYSTDNHDWIEILIRYGYFDQAHFIKDFKRITGKTPQQYFKSDKKLSSIFSGMA